MSDERSLYFQGGTLVVNGVGASEALPQPLQWIKEHWRCEAYHYARLRPLLAAFQIRDTVPRWQTLDLALHDDREPHDYQLAALAAWEQAGQQGSIVLRAKKVSESADKVEVRFRLLAPVEEKNNKRRPK